MSKIISQKYFFITITVFVIALIFIRPVCAQTPSSILSVSPVIFNISLSPGKKYNHILKVTNNLDVPLPIQLNVEPLETPDDGSPQGKSNNNIASWISFPTSDMIIEAKKQRSIDFQIQVPDRVPFGGYYGMIFLRPILPEMQGLPKEVSAKIGILLMGSLGVQDIPLNKVEIHKYGFDQLFYEKNEVKTDFLVKNTALNHFSAKPHLVIKSLFGSSQTINLEEKFVFPGKSRKWEQTITLSQFPHLFYKATLYVSVGGGIQKIASTYFVAFPFFRLLLFIFVITVGIVIMRRRGKLLKALHVLLKG